MPELETEDKAPGTPPPGITYLSGISPLLLSLLPPTWIYLSYPLAPGGHEMEMIPANLITPMDSPLVPLSRPWDQLGVAAREWKERATAARFQW